MRKMLQFFCIAFLIPIFVNGIFPAFQYLWYQHERPIVSMRTGQFIETIKIIIAIILFIGIALYIQSQDKTNKKRQLQKRIEKYQKKSIDLEKKIKELEIEEKPERENSINNLYFAVGIIVSIAVTVFLKRKEIRFSITSESIALRISLIAYLSYILYNIFFKKKILK